MTKTVTLHVGGGRAHRTHNARRYKRGQTPDHISLRRRGLNETLVDLDHRQAYRDLFGEAVAEYNAKQARPERQIADYYDKIRKDKAKYPVYEVIAQIGDKDTTGAIDCARERAILREYLLTFEANNPQMKVVGAYIHADEATLHAHLDFIPWADGYARGMERQTSMSKCCEQMGYAKGEHINETAQAAWTAAERERLEGIAQKYGIEVERVGDGRGHQEKADYIAQKEQEADEALTDTILKMVEEVMGKEQGIEIDLDR